MAFRLTPGVAGRLRQSGEKGARKQSTWHACGKGLRCFVAALLAGV